MAQYRYEVYNIQHAGLAAIVQEKLDKMVAAGYHVHTVNLNYADLQILWEKDGPAARLADAAEAQLDLATKRPAPGASAPPASPEDSILGQRSAPPVPPG